MGSPKRTVAHALRAEPTEAELLIEALDAVGFHVKPAALKKWTSVQRAEAGRYAAAVALAESPRPSFLPPHLFTINGGAYNERDTKPANVIEPAALASERMLLALDGPAGMKLSLSKALEEVIEGEGPALDLGIWDRNVDATAVMELSRDAAAQLGRALLEWSREDRELVAHYLESFEDLDGTGERRRRLLRAPEALDRAAYDVIVGMERAFEFDLTDAIGWELRARSRAQRSRRKLLEPVISRLDAIEQRIIGAARTPVATSAVEVEGVPMARHRSDDRPTPGECPQVTDEEIEEHIERAQDIASAVADLFIALQNASPDKHAIERVQKEGADAYASALRPLRALQEHLAAMLEDATLGTIGPKRRRLSIASMTVPSATAGEA